MRTPAPTAPFLLLSVRPEDVAADDEYAAFQRLCGLDERSLRRVRLDREPLAELDLNEFSGVILGGGPYNFSDPVHHKSSDQQRAERDLLGLLDKIVERDFPFLGCCYGIGTLGSHAGATVDRRFGEPLGSVPVTLSEAGLRDPLLAGLPPVFDAFVGHKEAISELPEHAVLLASSPTCPVQAFRIGSNVYATQFHPELDVTSFCTRIEVYRHHGYFEPDRADLLKETIRASAVIHPSVMLRTFVGRFGRPAVNASEAPSLDGRRIGT
jgi:GMP synthase (glutamine-hydrolysing)